MFPAVYPFICSDTHIISLLPRQLFDFLARRFFTGFSHLVRRGEILRPAVLYLDTADLASLLLAELFPLNSDRCLSLCRFSDRDLRPVCNDSGCGRCSSAAAARVAVVIQGAGGNNPAVTERRDNSLLSRDFRSAVCINEISAALSPVLYVARSRACRVYSFDMSDFLGLFVIVLIRQSQLILIVQFQRFVVIFIHNARIEKISVAH